MKSIQFKAIFFVATIALVLSSCTKDGDAEVPVAQKTLLAENFNNANTATSGYAISAPNWTSYAEQGTKMWLEKNYKNDGYALFSSFLSGQPVNVSWLISPAINMDNQDGEKLFFQSCQDGYIRSKDNSLELYVSTDYDGTTFATASWQKIDFNVPNQDTYKFIYLDSGIIDLSKYTGTLHFAFKVKGTSALTGGYQIDNVRVFY